MPTSTRQRLAAPLLLQLLAVAACAGSQSPAAAEAGPPPGDGVVITYVPPSGAPPIRAIAVPGTFNDWSTTATPMVRQATGAWRVRIRDVEGPHEYKFFIDGVWVTDMCRDARYGDPAKDFWVHAGAQGCVPDGHGGRNAVMNFRAPGGAATGPRHDPRSATQLSVAGGRLSVRLRAPEQEVRSASLVVSGQTIPMHLQLRYQLQEVWRGTLPEGTARYAIAVQTSSGTRELGPFAVPGTPFRAVPWVGEAVGYQIFPERFWNGNPGNDHLTLETDEYAFLHPSVRGSPPVLTREWNGPVAPQHCCHQYFGGDLQGIVDRLDHLQSLGVTLLYLNPIFSSGSAHGYDTWDYLAVEPSLGDERVLRTLLEQARARGMRVMWDFVPNHVGVGHAAFQDAVARGAASPYWRWFTFKVPAAQVQPGNASHYEAWWGFGSLPEVRTRDPAVLAHLMDVVRHWTRFGFDGIRVDVPGEIENRAEFFQAFRRTAKGINPDVYLVGEIWQRSPGWLQGDQFDALMNYAIGQDVIERFARGELAGDAALAAMARLYAEYPEASAAMQFNVIATHDNARLLTKMGGGRLGAAPGAEALARQRLASAMLYALPGVPVTFQGDECAFLGAGGSENREENRYPLQWASCDQAMVAHYRQLAWLKRELAALASPVIRTHHGEGTLLAWLRGEPGAGEVLALFNAGPAGTSLPLPAGSWTDAVSGQRVSGSAAVGPVDWRYLRRE